MHSIPPAERFSRQLALPGFGAEAQLALANARVLVIGAGGLGSGVIPALVAAGVGTVGVVDDDTVESSNLHRQLLHGEADIGRSKVASAADSVARLSAATRFEPHALRLDATNALELFSRYDLVIDGSDNFATRYLANDAAALSGIALVWGAVSQYAGQVGAVDAATGPNYRDLFPAPPPPGSVPSCAEGGVLPTVCAVIASIMANEAIKLLTGIGRPLLGRVTSYDALGGGFRELAFERDPLGEPITGLIDYELFCGVAPRPAPAAALAPLELAELLALPQPPVLLDVREPWEAEIASLPGAVLIPLGTLEERLDAGSTGLDTGRPVIAYCHHGIRSQTALALLRARGFAGAQHLGGGIDAWRREVDPAVARY